MLRRLVWIALVVLAGYGVYQYAGSDEAEIKNALGQRAIELEKGARELTEQARELFGDDGQAAMERAKELQQRARELLVEAESRAGVEAREAAEKALDAAEAAIREAREKLNE